MMRRVFCWLSNFLQWWILANCPHHPFRRDSPVDVMCERAAETEVTVTQACVESQR